MSALQALAVLLAGVAAGTINGVIGSGTLISFPVLLAIGYSPVSANVTNNLGLVPGAISAVYRFREGLEGQRRRLLTFAAAHVVGATIGAILLLSLPRHAFKGVVPFLIGGALVMVALQPKVSAAIAKRRDASLPAGAQPWLRVALFGAAIYGGYFGAAQGIVLFALLGSALPEDQQALNGTRMLLAGTANATASVVFIFAAHVHWGAAALLAVGSTLGGYVGASVGSRLSPNALRGVVVGVGLVAIAELIF